MRILLHKIPYFITLSLFLILSFTFEIQSQSFVNINADLPGVMNGSTAWGDYDNDMDMDVLLSGESTGGQLITKLFNNDQGVFTETNSDLTGIGYGSVQWGDYDNDGDLDILATGANEENRTFIFRNDNLEFVDINPNIEYFDSYSSACWGDYDNDGDLDVFITGGWNSKLYRNEGQDTFIDTEIEFMMLASSRAVWGDYDKDNDLDLLLTGDTGGGMVMYCYINNEGDFEGIEFANMGLASGSVDWGDYDSDGDLDILIMGFNNYIEPDARIYRNDGTNIFHNIYAGLPPVALGTASWGDNDNDGDLDILITGKFSGCGAFASSVYENMGNDNFNDISAGLTNAERSCASWGDFDNDTDLDIILTGGSYTGGRFTHIYRNDMSLPNILPDAPVNLTSDFVNNEIVLSWDPGFDAQTPESGLSYNVRIGTSPHEFNLLSPMAHIENGFRKINARGNAGNNTSLKMKNLEPGVTYYWSVQTIDHTFQASVFSEEQSFYFTSTGLENYMNEKSELNVYPNPANEYIFINSPSSIGDIFMVEIFTVEGELMIQKELNSTESLDISMIPKGIYIIQTTLNGNQIY